MMIQKTRRFLSGQKCMTGTPKTMIVYSVISMARAYCGQRLTAKKSEPPTAMQNIVIKCFLSMRLRSHISLTGLRVIIVVICTILNCVWDGDAARCWPN